MAKGTVAPRPVRQLINRAISFDFALTRRLSRLCSPAVSLPIIETCPVPTCNCTATPEGLDIDHKLPIEGTKPPYHQHVVICTDKTDWTSKIEDEEGPNVAKELKALLGPRGRSHNPYRPVLITNASFPSADLGSDAFTALLFPSFQQFDGIALSEPEISKFAYQTTVVPPRGPLQPFHSSPKAINHVIVLICGHGGRDRRCGVFGPLLEAEFQRVLRRAGIYIASTAENTDSIDNAQAERIGARVALVSHIGGHKFAGNLILYIPPTFYIRGRLSPIAGRGIWYGRVEPKHVQGIVEETMLGGRLINELFRGITEPWE